MKGNVPFLAFNRGLVSSSMLVRVDVERMRLSAEIMENWRPRTGGSMFLRPGSEYLGNSRNDAYAKDIEFIAATDDTALIELADGKMRVRVNDVLISRVPVATAISNSSFTTSTGWSDGSTGGGTLAFGGSGLALNAVNIGGLAVCRRQITVSGGDAGKRHALTINVSRGPVTFRCGSSSGGDDYIAETALRTGEHSLAFTPVGNFHLTIQSDIDVDRIVTSCAVAAAGTMELSIPYDADDLALVDSAQSADVIFLACAGHQQRRIERRATDSWSLVRYTPDKGPFFASRSAKVRLKSAANSGNTTLTSDLPFFKAEHVGAIFRVFQGGRNQSWKLGADGAFTDAWRVNGVGADNDFSHARSGTWTGTLQLQRSYDDAKSGFIDIPSNTFTTNGSSNFTPGSSYDNVIAWYRYGFKPGNYVSGTATIDVTYRGDGGYGVCRVVGYVSPTQVNVEVLSPFYGTEFSDNWQEGIWSSKSGWPSSVVFHKGRLWWAGKGRFVGSVSDDFENFDPDFEGDAGPINRTLGAGPVDQINFMLPLGRLIVGTIGAEFSIKSNSIDEPLTPQNAQAGDPSTIGSRKGSRAIKVDNRGVMVQRAGKRAFELVFSPDSYEYEPRDLTLLSPDLTGAATIVDMAVQRQPDTRIHCWLSDGRVAMLTYEPSEEVTCWSIDREGGNGAVEGVSVLPGEEEDRVYLRVRRTINGVTRRFLQKVALESECVGGSINKQADAFVIMPAVTGTAVAGLSHLEGEEVIAWGGGRYLGAYTVSGGAITLAQAVTATDVLVGLPYEARYKSTKLAYAAAAGTALAQTKKPTLMSAICGTVHNDGLYFGRDFDNLDPLPRMYDGRAVEADEVFTSYEQRAVSFPGEWNVDSRFCLKASAPKPCELLGIVLTVQTNETL